VNERDRYFWNGFAAGACSVVAIVMLWAVFA
jgi:hypothetical protein